MKTTPLLFGIISLLVITSCSSANKADEKEGNVSTVLPDEQSDVKVIRLVYGDFNHELVSNGTVSATKKADLRFDVSEIIERIHVKNGSRVTKGQMIASLDQFKLKNGLSQAKDNLERAKLELQDVLIGQGYTLKDSTKIPQEVMKIARVRSNYDNSLVQYELASRNLKNSVLYAPFDGVIANLFSKEYNQPSNSEPFCTVIGSDNLEADFMILESELSLVNMNDKVMISPFSIANYTIEGRIVEVNPVVDKNGMVRVKASLGGQGNGKIYDGMNVKVHVQRQVGKQLVIPKEALVLRTNKKVVFTVKNGKALWNYVQTGMENSTGYAITEGLNEGDSVVYAGNINLAHETSVNVIQ